MKKKSKREALLEIFLKTGGEWNYSAGVPLSALQTYTHVISNDTGENLDIGLSYFDGIIAIGNGVYLILDESSYLQSQQKIQGCMNILSGVSLIAFTYNPVVTQALGLTSAVALAPPIYSFALLSDIVNATINYMRAYKETRYEGWREERIKERLYLDERINKITQKMMKTKSDKKFKKYCDIKLSCEIRRKELGNIPSKDEWLQNINLQAELKQMHDRSALVLALKSASFVGATLSAVSGFVVCPPLLMTSIAITSIVAAVYVVRNTKEAYRLSASAGFFKRTRDQDRMSTPLRLSACKAW